MNPKDIVAIYVRVFCLWVSSKSLIMSSLAFRSVIHFEFIFVYVVRECSVSFFYM